MANGGHEGVGAAVVTGVDAPPILEFAEHALDPVTLAAELPVMGIWIFRSDFGGMQAPIWRSARVSRSQQGCGARVILPIRVAQGISIPLNACATSAGLSFSTCYPFGLNGSLRAVHIGRQ